MQDLTLQDLAMADLIKMTYVGHFFDERQFKQTSNKRCLKNVRNLKGGPRFVVQCLSRSLLLSNSAFTSTLDKYRTAAAYDRAASADCCQVCLVVPRSGVALVPCGHTSFCATCVDTLVQHDSTCPICRSIYGSNDRWDRDRYGATLVSVKTHVERFEQCCSKLLVTAVCCFTSDSRFYAFIVNNYNTELISTVFYCVSDILCTLCSVVYFLINNQREINSFTVILTCVQNI